MYMRFFAAILVIGGIIFFVPKTYTTHPGTVSNIEYKKFNVNKKKCLGFDTGVTFLGVNNSTKQICVGWVSPKGYIDIVDDLIKQ